VQVQPVTRAAAASRATGPVLLATFATPVDPRAERLAIESALEAGLSLVLVNAITMPHAPRSHRLELPGRAHQAVRATARRAARLGIRTELLHVVSPRPARAIVEIANERCAALVVLGQRTRRTARKIRRGTSCLIWSAGAD
jgi:nucleotide-binding universal stress UspA family protein